MPVKTDGKEKIRKKQWETDENQDNGPLNNKCRKRDIDASGLYVKDIQDIPGLMDILDWDRRSF